MAVESAYCAAYTRAFDIIGRRWTGAILRAMLTGATRFGEIAGGIPGLSDRLLSERLKELESVGILTRTVTPSTPVLIEYRLTQMGAEVAPIVDAVDCWATRWVHPDASSEAS